MRIVDNGKEKDSGKRERRIIMTEKVTTMLLTVVCAMATDCSCQKIDLLTVRELLVIILQVISILAWTTR